MTSATATAAPTSTASVTVAFHVHVCQKCLKEGHTRWHAMWADTCDCAKAEQEEKDCPAHDPWWADEAPAEPEDYESYAANHWREILESREPSREAVSES